MKIARLRAPIVMVHGLLGFDRMAMGHWVLADYFRGIPNVLRAAGNRVLLARLSPTGGIADRAAQLKEQIDKEYPDEPVGSVLTSRCKSGSRPPGFLLLSWLLCARPVIVGKSRA